MLARRNEKPKRRQQPRMPADIRWECRLIEAIIPFELSIQISMANLVINSYPLVTTPHCLRRNDQQSSRSRFFRASSSFEENWKSN